ncbi:Protein MCM10 [Gossypium australe]|uniref:Protein MCM10 n=1 Tax=Gossypium australe TaxID=47621 RepID=A0A5B6V9A4_9ROSI|nr:Protein MCM10 [Gossypium australe]
MDPKGVVADDVESNTPAPVERTVPIESGPVTLSQGGGAREAFLHMMNVWYSEFVHANPNASPHPPPPIPQPALTAPQIKKIGIWIETEAKIKCSINRLVLLLQLSSIFKVSSDPGIVSDSITLSAIYFGIFGNDKQEAEEFRANIDDNPERADFWLENTIRVFDELSCTLEECMKCVVSLLRDLAYQWWNTLVSVVPRERITWDFFQEEFRKKYISQRFTD